MPQWRWVLTDNKLSPVGEMLNVYDRRVALPMNGLATASYRLRLDHPLAEALQFAGGYVKIYRDNELVFYGPNVSAEESVSKDTATLGMNAVDAGWVLQHRLVGKAKAGYTYNPAHDRAYSAGVTVGMATADNDTYLAAYPGYNALNPTKYSAFGRLTAASYIVPPRTYTLPVQANGATGTYNAVYKSALDVIRELSTGRDGFDWAIVPYDNHKVGVPVAYESRIGELRAWPTRGQDREDAVFEWGTGRNNIENYKRTCNRNDQANKVYHIAAPGPDAPGYPVVSAIDPTSISNWGLLEDLAAADLLEPTLRQRLVDEHVRVRSNPRQTVEVTPHLYRPGVMPNYNEDFELGDNVRVRIKFANRVLLDALVRVWGVTFDINEMGVERMNLLLSEES
jgi:hypothetical protein